MTVYAPVPVPVNGNTHYTSESIERLPTGNGNISDLLRTNLRYAWIQRKVPR